MITSIEQLLQFLERLNKAHIYYTLARNRPDAITVAVAVPGQLWEIDIMSDGQFEIEIFQSDGTIYEEPKLEDLFRGFSD